MRRPTPNWAPRCKATIIEDIPLNGRNFENLLQLNPGVTIYPGGAGCTQSTNGQRPHDNVYMVNGIMANDPWMGQSMFNAVMAAGDAGTIMPVDAIDEFKTEENPRAEYGWKPGAIVNVGVKSGTNTMHGSAYAYGRDTALRRAQLLQPGERRKPDQAARRPSSNSAPRWAGRSRKTNCSTL